MNKILAIEEIGPGWHGQPKALRGMVDGLLIDKRVFHVGDQSFLKKWTAQTKFEGLHMNAMDLIVLGPEDLVKKANTLLSSGEFERRREAVEWVLCAWILRGYIEGGFSGRPQLTAEALGNTLKVLEWGRTNLTEIHEGSLFNATSVWPVRAMYLEAYMSCYAASRGRPESVNFPLDLLLKESGQLIREVKAAYPDWTPGSPDLTTPSVIHSFAQALSMQGYYYAQLGEIAPDKSSSQNNFLLASQSYKRAARVYNPDDEEHSWFLHCALSNGAHSGRMTYEAALIILEEIRVSVPKMLRIWANTPLSQGGRDGVLSKAMAMESRLAEKIGKGVISKDGVLSIRDFDT